MIHKLYDTVKACLSRKRDTTIYSDVFNLKITHGSYLKKLPCKVKAGSRIEIICELYIQSTLTKLLKIHTENTMSACRQPCSLDLETLLALMFSSYFCAFSK
jgi:hypothetical protein